MNAAPLFLSTTTRRRVYRPDEAPESAREKAQARELEGTEPEWISESVFGTCKETGLKGNEWGRGIDLEIGRKGGPSWSLFDKGSGVALTGSVVDVDRFLSFLVEQGELDAAQARRLRYVERDGGISLRFRPARGFYNATVAESDFGRVEWPTAEIDEAQATLAAAWETYVRTLARNAEKALVAEYEHVSAWSTIAEKLRDFDEGIDDEGRPVSLAECEEGTADDVDDEGDA